MPTFRADPFSFSTASKIAVYGGVHAHTLARTSARTRPPASAHTCTHARTHARASARPPASPPRMHARTCVHAGLVPAGTCGLTGGPTCTDNAAHVQDIGEQYTPATDLWTTLTSLPELFGALPARGSSAAVYNSNYVYNSGGYGATHFHPPSDTNNAGALRDRMLPCMQKCIPALYAVPCAVMYAVSPRLGSRLFRRSVQFKLRCISVIAY